ncbi:MAG: hypothetical protein GMKNLPBB_00089 [Myxococcota bacterium]|nr:hypothetical protein [Myxococcota bacterium]
MIKNVNSVLLVTGLAAAFAACGGPRQEIRNDSGLVDVSGLETKLAAMGQPQVFDLNGDLRPDVKVYYRTEPAPTAPGGQITYPFVKELDLNFDGKTDCWKFYINGVLEKELYDLDGDPTAIEVRNSFVMNQISQKEISIDRDEFPEIVKRYQNGQLVLILRDTNNDNGYDRRETYVNGRQAGVEIDPEQIKGWK